MGADEYTPCLVYGREVELGQPGVDITKVHALYMFALGMDDGLVADCCVYVEGVLFINKHSPGLLTIDPQQILELTGGELSHERKIYVGIHDYVDEDAWEEAAEAIAARGRTES